MTVQRAPGINAGHFYSNIVTPIKIDCNFVVDATNGNGLGLRSLKSNGFVRNVFMRTSSTPGSNDGYLNPNPAAGYALIQMKGNYNKYLGGFAGYASPVTGSNIAVASSSVLTQGVPYVITVIGTAAAPTFTVVTVADSSGSLASKYFLASDQKGNNYLFYNVVSGVGLPPSLTGALSNYVAIPVAFATNAANTAVASALSTAMGAVNGGNSFSGSVGGHTVTITGALTTVNFSPYPQDVNTGFTVTAPVYTPLATGWQGIGLPKGLTPTVGQSFIATATGSAVLTGGMVKASGVSGVFSVEVIGDPNASISNSNISPNGGAWLLVQFLTPTISTGAYVSPMVPTAPAAGTVIGLSFFFDGSSVTVDGL